ncbi:MAG: transposase [Acholeplasmataceae bacterium]|nr:transposase [Acholeplasmataceae bacterium]
MYLTVKHRLYINREDLRFFRLLMHAAKNLFNEALYNVRQHYFKTGQYLDYYANNDILSKESENYRVLNSHQAQMVIRKVDEAMKAFFGSIKSKAKGVRLPRYLAKDGFYPLIDRMVYMPNQEVYVIPRSNFIKRVSKMMTVDLDHEIKKEVQLKDSLSISIQTPRHILNQTIKEITIKPSFDGKYVSVSYVYETDEPILEESNHKETMSIDLGFNNLAMCAVTNSKHLLIDGKRLKSMNQYFHKRYAYLSSIRPNQKVLTHQMEKLIIKRNHQMTYYINKAARLIIDHAVENDVGEIIIGYNEGFKDINLSHQYNQMAKSIPLARLRDRLIDLAKTKGIKTKVVNESYTSVSSYIDQDPISKSNFSGQRIKRGLYRSKEGYLINADLNGALNILRKSKPEIERLGIRGWNTPRRTMVI